jgi:hypothetical protein
MMSNPEKTDDRRQFLKGGLRAILFGGIVYAGGLLGLRKCRSSGDDTEYEFELLWRKCGNCGKRIVCTDPKALKLKQDIQTKRLFFRKDNYV